MSMTPKQLELLLTYISNEIALNAIRGTGMAWARQQADRDNLTKKLRETVAEDYDEVEEVPQQCFSGGQLIMLLHIYDTNDFTKYLNPSWPEHTQALQIFKNKGIVRRTGIGTELEMTPKGHKFVEKLLYTKLD